MVVEINGSSEISQPKYWQRVGLRVREAWKMHQVSGQLAKGPDSWRNVPQHTLVQVARDGILGRWIGLPDSVISDAEMGSALHDYNKKQEITAIREANKTSVSPLAALRAEHERSEQLLRNAGFSEKVIRFAGSVGGDTPQLLEVQRILDQETISDEDWAFLIVHYIDDCSIGSDWVKPSEAGNSGRRINIIDYRERENRANPTYEKLGQEVTQELSKYPEFQGMSGLEVWSMISHRIEQRLAERIYEKRGETIERHLIPELVDKKIREEIALFAS